MSIEPFEVEYLVTEEGEIEWAVKHLRNNRSGDPSRMWVEHIKGWLTAARRAEKGETVDTDKVGPEDPQEGADNWTPFFVSAVSPFSALWAAASHPLMCSTRIRYAPPDRLLRRRLTAHSISPSSGTASSTLKGYSSTGMLSPGGGTRLYSANLSAVIRLSVTRAGDSLSRPDRKSVV